MGRTTASSTAPDLAGLQMTEPDPRARVAVFVIGAVEEDHVQVSIETHVARRSLHGDDFGLTEPARPVIFSRGGP